MDNIQKLTELFREFPGIGPRQAKRFVHFLLTKNSPYVQELSEQIKYIKTHVTYCPLCFRCFVKDHGTTGMCNVCRNETRDKKTLMILASDIDFENIEKTHLFNGFYFILGGTLPVLEKNPEQKIRQKELLGILDTRIKNGLQEIIIALSYNPEGENTLTYITNILKPITDLHNIKISTLGRGLSTGTEIEYSDSDTIKNALKNRQ